MIKPVHIIYLSTLGTLFFGCSKDNDEDIDGDSLQNSSWVAVMADGDPSTNPTGDFSMNGKNQYYPWPECRMDDTFTFSDNSVTIDENDSICDNETDLISAIKDHSYYYNADKKQLMIGDEDNTITLDVYELNKDRLKLGVRIPTGVGYGNMIFLFRKK